MNVAVAQLNNRIQSRITPEMAESIMEIPAGSVQAVAWLVLQAEADGLSVGDIATNLSVTIEQIQSLKEATTGMQGEDCEQCWMKGIVAIRTSQQLNHHSIAAGWDSLEAMALEKLNNSMHAMQSNGDPDKMLAIAVAANKAQRRNRGEANGPSRNTPTLARGNDSGRIDLELSGGNVGSIRLSLSPKIQEQLATPGRVIDGVANNAAKARKLTDSLQMLKLGETRELIEGTAQPKTHTAESLDPRPKQFDTSNLPSVDE